MEIMGTVVELASAAAGIVAAVVMYSSVKEVQKDRRLRFLERRLEEFYTPLIKYFGQGDLLRDQEVHRRVEEIIVSKRHLCGEGVARILPQHFTAVLSGSPGFYFEFENDHELNEWKTIADSIWGEYMEVLKEYYKLIGVESFTSPEKPRWMFILHRGSHY